MAMIMGEEAVQTVLQSDHESFPRARFQKDVLSPLFREALISLEGAEWRWQRRAVAPVSIGERGAILVRDGFR